VKTYLHLGGLVAAGFDATGAWLLTVSHSGRGIFSTATWERVARDYSVAYPDAGASFGIGAIAGQSIPVVELDFDSAPVRLTSPDGRIVLDCESSLITVEIFAP
jgi:hypothetical protein